MKGETDRFHLHMNTELYTIIFIHRLDGTEWKRMVHGYTIHSTDYCKTGCTCRNGHFSRGKPAREKRRSHPRSFLNWTSNLGRPLGNMEETVPFKRDSLHHIPACFVICFDSKSILKLGLFDSSNLRSSSLNIPAHMNHSKSWLPEGISCPAFRSLSFSPSDSSAEIWAGAHRALIWTRGREGGVLGLARGSGSGSGRRDWRRCLRALAGIWCFSFQNLHKNIIFQWRARSLCRRLQ